MPMRTSVMQRVSLGLLAGRDCPAVEKACAVGTWDSRRIEASAHSGPRLATSPQLYSSSPSCSAATGVSVPKRPSCSSLMPALKYRVVEEPAAPLLAKVRDHRPLMVRMESSGLRTNPMNFLVKPLNAAILPL